MHIDDIAELYVAALRAEPESVYAGVGVNPTAKECALAVARSGLDGKVASLTLEQRFAVLPGHPGRGGAALGERHITARSLKVTKCY
ncbi:hypothetical protein [Streptomyces sp. IBSBF 3136]|uniref:hypothetical protein n=1 Tax=Streptomyces sp. IBSBF 3136 TaxID=2903524 RepID=UPI002FDBC84D